MASDQSPRDRMRALESYPIDDPTASLPFSRRLEREQWGWTPAFTSRAITEYRRFIFLAGLGRGEVTPSEAVDQVWHLHLVYTRDYREFCAAGGAFIEHGPTRGSQETSRFAQQYESTIELYREFFGEPPVDIWPAAEERFRNAGGGRWVDLSEAVVISRRRLALFGSGLIGLAVLAGLWQNLA